MAPGLIPSARTMTIGQSPWLGRWGLRRWKHRWERCSIWLKHCVVGRSWLVNVGDCCLVLIVVCCLADKSQRVFCGCNPLGWTWTTEGKGPKLLNTLFKDRKGQISNFYSISIYAKADPHDQRKQRLICILNHFLSTSRLDVWSCKQHEWIIVNIYWIYDMWI